MRSRSRAPEKLCDYCQCPSGFYALGPRADLAPLLASALSMLAEWPRLQGYMRSTNNDRRKRLRVRTFGEAVLHLLAFKCMAQLGTIRSCRNKPTSEQRRTQSRNLTCQVAPNLAWPDSLRAGLVRRAFLSEFIRDAPSVSLSVR